MRCPIFNINYKTCKRQETPDSQQTRQSSESDVDVKQVLELYNRKFKRTTISMLKALVDNLNSMQTPMSSNFSREMETIRAKWKCYK